MNDDFSIFWYNDEHAQGLFYDLLARSERHAYDDDFLMQLAAYREAAPASERADIFAAKYLLHHGDVENTAVCAERAYAKRPVNLAVWKVLFTAYQLLDREVDALTMCGHIKGMYPEEDINLSLPEHMQLETLTRFSLAANNTCYAPLITGRVSIKNNKLDCDFDIFIGEEIPLVMPPESPRFWVGNYVDEGFLSTMSTIFEPMRHNHEFFVNNRDVTFDIQKAVELTGSITITVPEGYSVAVPIAGTQFYQNFSIETVAATYPAYLGKWAFSYIRLNETATLHSNEASFAVGTPILLKHNPARKKLVLNLLVDGFC